MINSFGWNFQHHSPAMLVSIALTCRLRHDSHDQWQRNRLQTKIFPDSYGHMGMSWIALWNISFTTLKVSLHYRQVMSFLQTEESSFLTHLSTTKMPYQQYNNICTVMGKIKCFLCSSGGSFPVQLSPSFMCLLGHFYLHKVSHPVKVVLFVPLTRWKPWGRTGCTGGKKKDTCFTEILYS